MNNLTSFFDFGSLSYDHLFYNTLSNGTVGLEFLLQNVFFGGIGVAGIFLGFYIILSYIKKQTFNIFLGAYTLTTALILIELVLYWWEDLSYNPTLPFYNSLIFLWAPSLYLYLKKMAEDACKTTSKTPILRHYLIFIVSLLSLAIIGNMKVGSEVTEYSITWFFITYLTNNWIKAIYFSFYIVLMVRDYINYRKLLDRMPRTWAKALISFFIFLLLIVVLRAEFEGLSAFDYLTKYLGAYCFSIFIIILGFLNILYPSHGMEQTTNRAVSIEKKYKNSGLTSDMLSSLTKELLKAMEEDELFLDHKLTLQTLSETLNTDRYSLSQVINQKFNKNFYEFINDYRINESVKIIEQNPKNIRLVRDLIYESGFNNKVSFYRAFKKRKRMTPAKYIKQFSV